MIKKPFINMSNTVRNFVAIVLSSDISEITRKYKYSTMKIMERNTIKYGFFPMHVTLFRGYFCLLYCIQPVSWNYPLS